MKILGFLFLPLLAFSLILSTSLKPALAVPPPPSLKQLCQESNLIVSGHYVGGMVSETKGCEFWVTFQIKPEKFYKQAGNLENLKVLQFKKRYFVDNKKCSRIPGPNAMPGVMKEELKKPKHEKKVFFFKETQGTLQSLSNLFWGIVDWDTAAPKWHKEFKETSECHS